MRSRESEGSAIPNLRSAFHASLLQRLSRIEIDRESSISSRLSARDYRFESQLARVKVILLLMGHRR